MTSKERENRGLKSEAGESAHDKPAAGTGQRKKTGDLIIVGIGASAGGLDALQRVLPGLPAEAGIAYVIAQHLAPKPRTLLPSLLAKHTSMSVETISDGMTVQPNTIHITPPNKDVKLCRNRLKLTTASSIGPKPSIDYFFSSLAEEKKAHAVGIILSGSGSDGAHGIRAIKSNDGITMAQTVDSAKFYSMPQAAIDTGLVDLILPPEKIGQELQAALKYPYLIAKVPLDARMDEIGTILDLLQQDSGVDFSDYKQNTIHRRISRRMVVHKIHDLQDYLAYIKSHPRELASLRKDLLISVTSFFRDAKAFEALARRLRELLQRKEPGDSFRVWVPGCSSGEEAYSIAILVAEILGGDLSKYRIQIFATDVDEDLVQLARRGIYPLATVMDTDGRRFEKHFSHSDNAVKVNKHIRDMVVLARQDLVKDTPFLHLDLISCRNLMIYINAELQDKLLSLFHFSLNPEGLLFLGKSESTNQRMDLFKAVDARWKIYRRKEVLAKRLPKLVQSRSIAQLTSYKAGHLQQEKGILQESAFVEALVGALACCAVLTDEHANILYIRGDVSPYFKIPEGSVKESLNAVEMARPEIRYALQSLLHKSAKEERTVASNGIACGENGKGVQISVGPAQGKVPKGCRMIVLTPVKTPRPSSRRTGASEKGDYEHVRELEQELEVTREHLQDTIEELETTTEELQSLNEELQSANEELQASNEELETSNEELQASNEELNTVNDELRAKSEEAVELLADLKKSEIRYRLLVDNMNEALMLCELAYGPDNRPMDLLIKQANRALEQLIGIGSHELPMRAEAAHLQDLATRDMLGQLMAVARGGASRRFELHLGDLDLDLTISVYALDEKRLGIVCHDDTERKRIQTSLRELNESLERQVTERTELAEARARQLQNLSVELIEAEERERRRIAELLHDDLQQLLATARLQLQAACPNMQVAPELESVEKLLDDSIRKSRRLSHELSPPVLLHSGLVAALQWLAQQMELQFGLQVELEAGAEQKFERPDLKVFLFRAAQELLFNVVKHAGVKKARVHLSDSDTKIVLTVTDNGQGFLPDSLDASTAKAGFGLLSLKARAHHIGGNLEIESIPGQGSRFTLAVPLRITPVDEPQTIVAAVQRTTSDPSERTHAPESAGLRVLFVDDHKVMRQGLIQLIAGQQDIQIVGEASNGREALEQARRLHPDVIVMDVSMPEMDGVEATRRIMSEMPAVRVIGLSMFEDEQIAGTMHEAGAEAFVSKTASSAELLKAIYGIEHDG